MSGFRSPDHQITRSPDSQAAQSIVSYYLALLRRWGPQNWWPAQSRFEVIVGAYLTQNTNWTNVEKAIANLRSDRALSLDSLRKLPLAKLEILIRPSGYYRQKALKLKTFIRHLDKNYSGSLDRMFAQPTEKLREELLSLNGVGPETADSILLYAGGHAVFVVDAYTRRILERHGIITPKTSYEDIRLLIEQAVQSTEPEHLLQLEKGADPRHPQSRMSRAVRSELAQHYNELHALIVRAGNQFCRSTPKCEGCPLRDFLPAGAEATVS
ncbi:MAG TPA: endonuclease III domain-containing protein [Candidatus Angelobacter sp.]|jgi:endonuclease-3 related protein|nr:endonuclease III domain-containing protein [Candidatus Angelobacter sp.]